VADSRDFGPEVGSEVGWPTGPAKGFKGTNLLHFGQWSVAELLLRLHTFEVSPAMLSRWTSAADNLRSRATDRRGQARWKYFKSRTGNTEWLRGRSCGILG
jgi:hypothetical protein